MHLIIIQGNLKITILDTLVCINHYRKIDYNIIYIQKKYLIYQLVLGINYLHKVNIIHRDIVI